MTGTNEGANEVSLEAVAEYNIRNINRQYRDCQSEWLWPARSKCQQKRKTKRPSACTEGLFRAYF